MPLNAPEAVPSFVALMQTYMPSGIGTAGAGGAVMSGVVLSAPSASIPRRRIGRFVPENAPVDGPPTMEALHLLKAFPQFTSQVLIASDEEPMGRCVPFLQPFTHSTFACSHAFVFFFCGSEGAGLFSKHVRLRIPAKGKDQ